MNFVPKKIFLTKGVGKHKEKLASFELALRDAGIAYLNLVNVSSIFPPYCKLISRREGLKYFEPGQIAFCVMSRDATNEPNRLVSASIGIAMPKDKSKFGYLSEHHGFGQTQKYSGDYAEDLAVQMLGTTMGLTIDLDKSWDQNKEQWKLKGEVVYSRNITQSAEGDKNGLWTTVITAAMLILENGD
ncbi:MAG: arginine decarboxylase, pyruvoyl-dependent [candidate division Zixibacteria bacterium]|nr:arginine decarboxylase, pyruvoyl-dependent [candidate division Zixibacteria bacterium]